MTKESSPFTPGNPVPVELFVGRSEQIRELIRYVKQTRSGRAENVFLAGDRGIGKSSLASFLRYYVSTQENMLGIHVFLGRVSTLEGMVRHIFEQILKEAKIQGGLEKVTSFFAKHIKEIGLFGISVSFSPQKAELEELVTKFPEAISHLLAQMAERKNGLFIVLDDINGLVEKPEFADWYKSFADEVATHYKSFPVFVILTGLPEKRDILSHIQPSLMRIFRVVGIEKLSDEEVRNFLRTAFEKTGIKVQTDAMDLMVRYSSGLPVLMHEIGDATFWGDEDGVVDVDDAARGVINAAEKVGQKYLDPKVYRAIRSESYRSILRKLGRILIGCHFKKKEVAAKLDDREKRVFDNFLNRMRKLGVIEPDVERGRGAYNFINEIYPLYITMESEKSQKKPAKQ